MKLYFLLILTLFLDIAHAQEKFGISINSGFFFSKLPKESTQVQSAFMIDQYLLGVGFTYSSNKNYTYKVDLGLSQSEIANKSSLFFTSSIGDVNTIVPNANISTFDYELSINSSVVLHQLHNWNTFLPEIYVGLNTIVNFERNGSKAGSTDIRDVESGKLICSISNKYNRLITPFLTTGLGYSLYQNRYFKIPVEIGYRFPIFSSYHTQKVSLYDENEVLTETFTLKKSGFATYLRFGLIISF